MKATYTTLYEQCPAFIVQHVIMQIVWYDHHNDQVFLLCNMIVLVDSFFSILSSLFVNLIYVLVELL